MSPNTKHAYWLIPKLPREAIDKESLPAPYFTILTTNYTTGISKCWSRTMLIHMSSMRMVFHHGKILLMECIPLGLECSIHQKFKWRCSRAFAHPRVLQVYVSITTTPSTWNDFFSEAYHYHPSSNLEKEEALGYFLSILLYTNCSATNGIYPVLG